MIFDGFTLYNYNFRKHSITRCTSSIPRPILHRCSLPWKSIKIFFVARLPFQRSQSIHLPPSHLPWKPRFQRDASRCEKPRGWIETWQGVARARINPSDSQSYARQPHQPWSWLKLSSSTATLSSNPPPLIALACNIACGTRTGRRGDKVAKCAGKLRLRPFCVYLFTVTSTIPLKSFSLHLLNWNKLELIAFFL